MRTEEEGGEKVVEGVEAATSHWDNLNLICKPGTTQREALQANPGIPSTPTGPNSF